MYIDNTYISSLDELKEIIESHIKENEVGKSIDDFATELIESYEGEDLQDFLRSLHTNEADSYLEYLRLQNEILEKMSSNSSKFNALIAYFTNSPYEANVSQFVDFLKCEVQDGFVRIELRVKQPANENISFELAYYTGKGEIIHTEKTEPQSLMVNAGAILQIKHPLFENHSKAEMKIYCEGKLLAIPSVGRVEKQRNRNEEADIPEQVDLNTLNAEQLFEQGLKEEKANYEDYQRSLVKAQYTHIHSRDLKEWYEQREAAIYQQYFHESALQDYAPAIDKMIKYCLRRGDFVKVAFWKERAGTTVKGVVGENWPEVSQGVRSVRENPKQAIVTGVADGISIFKQYFGLK